jgi:hypothetical protein
MSITSKGKSPFYPGQPVPVELFVGRASQIDRILVRGVNQVYQGKPVAMFIQGEYGIGKSSIAGFVQSISEQKNELLGIYAPLGGVENLQGVATAIVNATVRSGAYDPTKTEKIRNVMAKYIESVGLFGVNINLEAIKKDAAQLGTPTNMLDFFSHTLARLNETGIKGIFLILDEINGITADPQFAHFIKGLVDQNALSPKPLPLLLMLCGVEEKRREMILKHQPVDRIFDVIAVETMDETEMKDFFNKAFNSVQIKIQPRAMNILTKYSAGFPKLMHLVGDSAYWLDQDGVIDEQDAFQSVIIAAEEVGKKYVDQQVYKALRSKDYHSILAKIAKMGPDDMSFTREQVVSGLTQSEKGKFDNFLTKMKKLKVIRAGENKGEYVFNMRMVRLYIWLQSSENKH